MGNDTGGIEITVIPPAVAPLGGNDEYATATPTSVNGRIAYAAQHFNGFHIRWTDHGKRVPLHIHTIQYHLHRLVNGACRVRHTISENHDVDRKSTRLKYSL